MTTKLTKAHILACFHWEDDSDQYMVPDYRLRVEFDGRLVYKFYPRQLMVQLEDGEQLLNVKDSWGDFRVWREVLP